MVLFNYIFSGITAWSLGYVCVNSRKNKYEKWYGVFFYITLLIVSINLDFGWEYSLLGLLVCILTTYYTYIPKLENGYNSIV